MALESPSQLARQHRVLRQITESVGRLVARGVHEATGKKVPVFFEYQGEGKKTAPHLTIVNYWVERLTDRATDRELLQTREGEVFRAPPLLLTARFLLTAWATPPEDQELLIAAVRVLHDTETFEPDGEGEQDAIHFEDEPSLDLSTRFSLEEARQVCESLGMPLRPSLRYDMSFRLDSERKSRVTRVKERIVDYKKLDG